MGQGPGDARNLMPANVTIHISLEQTTHHSQIVGDKLYYTTVPYKSLTLLGLLKGCFNKANKHINTMHQMQ